MRRPVRKLTKNILIADTVIEPVPIVSEGWFAAIDLTVSIQVSDPQKPLEAFGYHYTFRVICQVSQDKRGRFDVVPTTLALFEITVQEGDEHVHLVISPRFYNPIYLYYLVDNNIISEFTQSLQETMDEESDSSENTLSKSNLKEEDDSEETTDFFRKWFSDMLLGYHNEELVGDEAIVVDTAIAVLSDYIRKQSE